MEQNKIFISYSHKDKVVATKICDVLESADIKCWIAPRDINCGEDYAEAMEVAIKKCDKFLLIFSKNSATSRYVKAEVNIAFCEGKNIIPYRIDNVDLTGSLRIHLNDRHWIEGSVKQLVSAIVNTEIIIPKPKHKISKIVILSIFSIIILSATLASYSYFFHPKYPQIIVKKKFGLINSLNKEILPVIYDEIETFSNGNGYVLIKVNKNGKYGVVTNKGNEVMEAKYNSIEIRYSKFIGKYSINNWFDEIKILSIEDIIRLYDDVQELKSDAEKPIPTDHNLTL